jgi:hypothetical protein
MVEKTISYSHFPELRERLGSLTKEEPNAALDGWGDGEHAGHG